MPKTITISIPDEDTFTWDEGMAVFGAGLGALLTKRLREAVGQKRYYDELRLEAKKRQIERSARWEHEEKMNRLSGEVVKPSVNSDGMILYRDSDQLESTGWGINED